MAKTDILCPDCGEPVYRRSQMRGKRRYAHRMAQKLDCKWWGTDPVGVEADKATGVDPIIALALKRKIIASRRGKVRYVITSAQNATPVFDRGWQTLLGYCDRNDARLLVIPFRYRNPTSTWSAKAQKDDWWAPEVLPYLINHRVDLNRHLVLLADIMTQPTASDPLEGFETISGAKSAIIGHPRLELTTVPTPQARLPKILTTTGAITRRNYIPSKAGKKGEFHHTFGAALVEVDGPKFHLRQINMARDGSFCDLLTEYDGSKATVYDRVDALVMGDTHVEVVDPSVVRATFGQGGILDTLKPRTLVWHDVFDGASNNHHERGRAFHEYVKYKAGRNDVAAEVRRTMEFIDKAAEGRDMLNVFVPSNHNDFLREWVENTDPRGDPANCMFWAETYLAVLRSAETRWTPGGVAVQDAFAYWGKKLLRTASQALFLRKGEVYQINGIEVGYHGHLGSGGKPGTREGFSRIGVRTIFGHGHAPGIRAGAYQVGTSSRLALAYMAGTPSAWLHTHCLVYPNGKRSLLNVIDGEYRMA